MEREEREKVRQNEKEKLDKEREEKEKEREHEKEMLVEKEKEREEKEKERQHEIKKLAMQLELTEKSPSGASASGTNLPKSSYIPKLPPFDEIKDDIDSFLFRFESHATSCGWPKEKWTLFGASLFKGSALVLYHTLAAKDGLTWDQLKEELLKKFQCTVEGFREKFRAVRPEKGESFPSFLIRISHYLDRWIELSKAQKNFQGLRDLLLREQLLQSVSKDLAVFICEREVTTAAEMCQAADQYRVAHPDKNIARKGEASVFEGNVAQQQFQNQSHFPQNYGRGGQNQSHRFQRPYQRSNQTYNQPRFGGPQYSPRMNDPQMYRQRFSGPQRFQQRSYGYGQQVQYRLPNQNKVQNANATSAAQSMQEQLTQKDKQSPKCRNCGCKFHFAKQCPYKEQATSNVAKEVGSGFSTHVAMSSLHLEQGSVNGFQATVLRDTGCTTAGVRKEYVQSDQFLDRVQKCRTFGGTIEEFPLAEIDVDTPYYTGSLTACVIEKPVCDLILGNLPGVSSVHGGTCGSFVPCLVSTRAQAERERKPQTPLSVPKDKLLELDPRELASLQRDDPSLAGNFAESEREVSDDQTLPFYVVENGILYRKMKRDQEWTTQIVVPESLREPVLLSAHDAILAGHCGVKRTLKRVLSSFFWPGVRKAVTNYCRSCDTCQKTTPKGRVPCAPLHKMPLISEPFRRVAIDLVSPFTPSSSGNRYVLTIVDTATRFPEAIPLKKIDTVTVAEALLTVFSRVGLPEEILSD